MAKQNYLRYEIVVLRSVERQRLVSLDDALDPPAHHILELLQNDCGVQQLDATIQSRQLHHE